MATKKVFSKPGPNGKTLHFDEKGKFIGSSFKSFNGNVKHLDANGKYAGTSFTAPSGAIKHFDAKGKYTGSSIDSALGGQIHFDGKGRPVGKSSEGFGNRYAAVFPDIGDDKPSEITYTSTPTTKSVNAGNTFTTVLGLVFITIIIAGVILLWDILWPLLFLGAILVLAAAANS